MLFNNLLFCNCITDAVEPEPQERIFIPPDFYCPITGELLQNPVSDPAGHTYEKEAIEKWTDIKKKNSKCEIRIP